MHPTAERTERPGEQRWRKLRNRSLWRLLVAGQRVGLDVLPHHFYSNVPDLRQLRATDTWRAPRSMVGVNGTDIAPQSAFLTQCMSPAVRSELSDRDVFAAACRENGATGFGPIEAEILFGFVATKAPRRVIQVGAGVSTSVVLQAKRAFDLDVEVTCVDPFPTQYLRDAAARGEIDLIAQPAQEVPVETFASLGDGDLLFIDSTHTVKPGSEVNYLVLDVLQALRPGTFVHFHDLLFPYDYPRDLLDGGLFFWNESALVHAFLIGNDHVTIRMSTSMLHHQAPDALKQAVPRYVAQPMVDGLVPTQDTAGHFPSSTYLQTLSR